MATESRRTRLRFGVFEVDLAAGELRRQGLKVKLHDKAFQLLIALLDRSGELVTRQELQRHLWPADTFVDFDNNLNNAISRLREALGDAADNPRFIETVPRRGYRFIVPITRWSPDSASQTPSASIIADLDAPSSFTLDPPSGSVDPTPRPAAES